MIRLDLPDVFDLRRAPELGALALLDAALVVADEALHLEHAELDWSLGRPDPERPREVIVAALLAARLRGLRTRIAPQSLRECRDQVRHVLDIKLFANANNDARRPDRDGTSISR